MTAVHKGRDCGSLSRRIFMGMATFAVLAVVVFGVAASTLFYYSYEQDAESQLVGQANQVAQALDGKSEKQAGAYLGRLPWSGMRCTLIAADGTVLYDNEADVSKMGNHADRQEFRQAVESGEASLTRHSQTLSVDMVYAAARLESGSVVRLAESRHSLASFLGDLAVPLGMAAVVVILLAFALSRAMTKRIMRPVDQLDLAHPVANPAYREMRPLLARIEEQHDQLKKQNKELEAAVQVRREFSANVSHEMKTPLQVISGYSELIEAGMVSQEDTARFAGLIRSEAKAMRRLIDDVLTLSRLDEAALGQSEVSNVDMAWLGGQIISRLESVADDRQVSLRLDADGPRALVRGSETLLGEMLYNLVDNAIRYNHPDGCVTVGVRLIPADQAQPGVGEGDGEHPAAANGEGSAMADGERPATPPSRYVRVTVADTGQGIPPAMRERVFERFYRLEEGRSRETGGTGLGLAIVKHTVQRYGGAVSVTETPGGGSTFVVDLPAVPAFTQE